MYSEIFILHPYSTHIKNKYTNMLKYASLLRWFTYVEDKDKPTSNDKLIYHQYNIFENKLKVLLGAKIRKLILFSNFVIVILSAK